MLFLSMSKNIKKCQKWVLDCYDVKKQSKTLEELLPFKKSTI